MSYLTKRYVKKSKRGLSGTLEDILNTITGTVTAGSTVVSAAQDPYLPEMLCHIGQLQALDRGQTPGDCAVTPAGLPGGVGLYRAMTPMRAYVYAEENKWVYPVAILAVLGLPFLVGYEYGKGKRS